MYDSSRNYYLSWCGEAFPFLSSTAPCMGTARFWTWYLAELPTGLEKCASTLGSVLCLPEQHKHLLERRRTSTAPPPVNAFIWDRRWFTIPLIKHTQKKKVLRWWEDFHFQPRRCGQQVKGGTPTSLLYPGEATPRILCLVLGYPFQKKQVTTAKDLTEDHKDE